MDRCAKGGKVGNRKVIEVYYGDVNGLVDSLTKLVNSYRLLIGGAAEINQITLAKKSEVRAALKRADKLGDIIDEVIDALDDSLGVYVNYMNHKSESIKCKVEPEYIETEIDQELKLQD